MANKKSRLDPFLGIIIGKNALLKKCTKCKRVKIIINNFSKDYDRACGYNSQCNACINSYGVLYRQRQLEKIYDGHTVQKCKCGLLFKAIFKQSGHDITLKKCQTCKRKLRRVKHDFNRDKNRSSYKVALQS